MSIEFQIGDEVYFKGDARKSLGYVEGMTCSVECGVGIKVEYDVHWVEYERAVHRERERLFKEGRTLIILPLRRFKADELARVEAA